MGNEFGKPSTKNILNPRLFAEYRDTKLNDIKEAMAYLGPKTGYLNKAEFEDAFSVLFKDPDEHFVIFEKSAVESQIPLSLREESKQPEGSVNPYIVCTIVSLLSSDSVDKKFVYLYEVHFDNAKDIKDNIKIITDNIIKGILALFKVQKVPPKHIRYGGVLNSLKMMRNSQRLQNERNDTNSNEDVFSLTDFFQLCQESEAISKILNAILQLCAKQQVVQPENASSAFESKLVSTEVTKSEKTRHPLWNFYILDMFNESWLTSLPQIANTRSVSSCIELFLYSGKKALPVYYSSSIPVFDAADASLITYDKN